MTISHEFILTLQQLRGFGPKKIEQIAAAISESHFKTMGLGELYDLLEELHRAGRLKGLSAFPEFDQVEHASHVAGMIMRRSEEQGIKMVSRYDSDFPANLLNTVNEKGKPDIPTLLFYKGDLSITKKPAVAIIGTREPSPQGTLAGEKLGEYFSAHGFNVVSGLALGCDSAGHRGALKSTEGATTAFLAHGLDSVYPPENTSLAEEIVDKGGLLMSEYAIGEHVNRNFLVNRDRLQAALADATIVIQTGIKGGTMHAVNATLAAGKRVYAVEYKVCIPEGRDAGNKWLVSEGMAKTIRSDNQEDVLNAILKSTSRPAADSKNAGQHDSNYPLGSLFNNWD